jgi:hypothetical protein
MLSDLYVFDLETFTWDKVEPAPDQAVPGPRYFHSADTCEHLGRLTTWFLLIHKQGTTTWSSSVEWVTKQLTRRKRAFVY